MKSSKLHLYIVAVMSGLLGSVIGAFAGGFFAASRCDGGLECLGVAVLGVGLGAIVFESASMALAVHKTNQRRGSLPRTFLVTIALAMPIPFTLLLAPTVILAVPLFLLQVWACVKVQTASGTGKRVRRRK